MTSFGENVRARRIELGWTQQQLADAAGVSQTTIDKIERGLTKRSRFIAYIAAALQVSYATLDPSMSLDITPPKFDHDQKRRESREQGIILVPLYLSESHKTEEEDARPDHSFQIPSSPMDFIPGSPIGGKEDRCYAMYVTTSTMDPELREGDMVIVGRDEPIISGLTYLFKSKFGDVGLLGRIIGINRLSYEVFQHKPQRVLSLPKAEWPQAHRVISNKYRF